MTKTYDGEEIILRCSNCRAQVVLIKLTTPPQDRGYMNCNIQAECPFCGDVTQVVPTNAKFHLLPASRPSPDEEDEVIPTVRILDYQRRKFADMDVMRLKTEKYSPDSKPIL